MQFSNGMQGMETKWKTENSPFMLLIKQKTDL